jgi:hypothetical protein
MLTSKSPQLSPSGLTKNLRKGSLRIPHYILTTRMKLWGFIKLFVLYLSVHMELSLHLSFYLRRILGGYTVGTITGSPIKIVEALAPQSHHRILWKCPQYHMSTCSAQHRVTDSGHPLDEWLGGYCHGNVPRVLWATGYDPKF